MENQEFEYFMKVIIFEDKLPIGFSKQDHIDFPTFEMHFHRLNEILVKVSFKPASTWDSREFQKRIEEKIRAEYNVYMITYLEQPQTKMYTYKLEGHD